MSEEVDTKTFTAALVIIGNEILSGRTQDKNTQYIASNLNERGIRLAEVRVVPDIEGEIVAAVNNLRDRNSYVFTTGGIGPTHDDITAASIAQAFDVDLTIHEEAYEILETHYRAGEFTPARQKMAMTPKGAALIPNPVSAAPGFVIENVYVMAGVPKIMQAMLDHILPGLAKGAKILSNAVGCDLPESRMAEALGDLQKKYPDVDIGSYPHFKDGD